MLANIVSTVACCQCCPASTRLAAHERRLVCEARIVDHAPSAGMSLVRHDQWRRAGAKRQSLPFGRCAAQDQRIRRPQHRVQVEQHVDLVDQRPDLARPIEFGRPPCTVQHGRVPHAVEVLVDEARRGRLAWSNRSYAARLTKPKVSRPRLGVIPLSSSRSRTIAPAISLPCASASSATCGPSTPGVARGEAANAGVAVQPATDVRRVKPHLERRKWRLRHCRHGLPASDQHAIHQAADEGVARVELLLCNPFIRLVCLRDMAGATDDRRRCRRSDNSRLPYRS